MSPTRERGGRSQGRLLPRCWQEARASARPPDLLPRRARLRFDRRSPMASGLLFYRLLEQAFRSITTETRPLPGYRPEPTVARGLIEEALKKGRRVMFESQRKPGEVTRAEISDQLRALVVDRGGVLLVHTSFRATRPVERGPLGLIEALRDALGPEGTLVMPSWTGQDDEPFDPTTTPASSDLGVVADTFWRLSGVQRSEHNFAFASVGPKAAEVLSGPLPLPPHIPESPVGRVYDLDGQVLLIGVGHDADTTFTWRNSLRAFRTAFRSPARSFRTDARSGSATERTTIAVLASPWQTIGCGNEASRPKAA